MPDTESLHGLKEKYAGLKQELKRAEAARQEQETRFTARLGELAEQLEQSKEAEQKAFSVLKASPNPIVVYTMDGKVQFLNQAFTRVFGWTFRELKGKKIDFVPAADLPETIEQIKKMISGEMVEFETRRHTKSGKTLEVQVSAGCFFNSENESLGSFVILRDITRQKLSEKKIKNLNFMLEKRAKDLESVNRDLEHAVEKAEIMAAEAREANKAKSNFLANMSHEIRTPMNGVIGMLDILMDTPLTPEQKDFARSAQQSADSLLILINDILDFSKIEAGRMQTETVDFKLSTTIEGIGDVLGLKAFEKGVEFASLIMDGVPENLRGDPGRLRQILTNLAGNAVKFTAEGNVFIRVSLKADDRTHVTLMFEVKDTGIGIPPDKQDMLFNSFTQVDASTTRKFGGTGLGLAISKQLVGLMNGEIGVESAEGKGSCFWFTAVFEKNRAIAPPVLRKQDIRGKKVIVVDDIAVNHDVFAEYLKSWHCEHHHAVNGPIAMEMIRGAWNKGVPFDIGLIDMQMPGMSGIQLGEQIKKTPGINSISLVMISSAADKGHAKEVEEIGFSAFLTKPIKRDRLYDCLTTVAGSPEPGPGRIITSYRLDEIKGIEAVETPSLKVLLAEDNKINQRVVKTLLKKTGHSVVIASNGKEAVDLYRKERFDLILMDIQMPVMDGEEAAGAIRGLEKESGKRTVIVALTANAMKGDRDRFLAADMDDYISKPFKKHDLLKMILKHGMDKKTDPVCTD